MNEYLRPDLATKVDIAALQSDIAGLERSLRAEIKSEIAALEQRLQRLIHQTQPQTLGVMAAMLGILFALLRFTGHSD